MRSFEIIQQSAALAHHDEKAAAGVEVFLVRRQMAGQVANPFAQDRHLDLGRAGIALLGAVFGDERLLALRSDRHRSFSSAVDGSYRAKAAVLNPGQSDQGLTEPRPDDRTLIEPVEPNRRAGFARSDPLPAPQPSSLGSRQDNSRDVVQSSLDREQKSAIR